MSAGKFATVEMISKTCDDCGAGFEATTLDIGTSAEWLCPSCCEVRHKKFCARHRSKNSPFEPALKNKAHLAAVIWSEK